MHGVAIFIPSGVRLTPALFLAAVSGLFVNDAVPCQVPDEKSREFVTEEIAFRHGANDLSGTLYLPNRSGPHPAVVMVLGSGEHDRNYGGTGPVLGRHFARHGFACLAWDKPGVGKSSGDFNAQSFRDRAEEALAAVDFLGARGDIRPQQIGLWGHSQGGMVAPLAASLSKKIAFVIDVGGWQGPAWRQDAVRVEAELRADGFSEADIAAGVALSRERMDLIRGNQPFEELERKQQAARSEAWFEYVHFCDKALFHAARRYVEYDTGPSWESVYCPVLVIFGNKDTSSGSPEPLLEIVRRGLTKAGNRELVVKVFRDADHSLCTTKTGGRMEGRERAKAREAGAGPDFVKGYLETMTQWMEERCQPSNGKGE